MLRQEYVERPTRDHNRRFCCYKGCTSDKLKTRNGAISFFGFPIKDTERCSKWITNSGREEFRYLTPKELSEKKICELHFEDKMFSNPFKETLLRQAVPRSWTNAHELIEIEDVELGSDSENIILTEESSVLINNQHNNSSESTHPVNNESDPLNNSASEEVTSTNGSILISALTNGEPQSSHRIQRLSQTNLADRPKTNGLNGNVKSCEDQSKAPSKNTKKKTKFHNLPPEMTTTDFYFQHCSDTAEETNHSLPDDYPAELPLFVQQNSIVSLAEEAAPSEVSEPPPKRRKRDKRDEDDLSDQIRETSKHLKHISELLVNNEDEFQIFGKSVALQLRKMSICTALKVQAKIQNLLSQYRIEDIVREGKVKPESKLNATGENSSRSKDDENSKGDSCQAPASPSLSLTCASEHSDNEGEQ